MNSKLLMLLSITFLSLNSFSAEIVCTKEEKCKATFATLKEARAVCFYQYMDETKVVQIEDDGSKTTVGYVCVSKSLN